MKVKNQLVPTAKLVAIPRDDCGTISDIMNHGTEPANGILLIKMANYSSQNKHEISDVD